MSLVTDPRYPHMTVEYINDRLVYYDGNYYAPSLTSDGYWVIYIWRNNVRVCLFMHRLKAFAFLPSPPTDPKAVVNHKDGKKSNLALDNLEFSTKSEDVKHAIKIGKRRTRAWDYDHHGQVNPNAKLTDDVVRTIRAEAAMGVSGRILANQYGVTATTISRIINRLIWTHI